TARFGYSSSLWSSTHTGLDFAAPYGTPVVSVANGVVRSTGYDGSYGNKVVIAHEDGTETWYAHLSAITVSPGESVNGGDLIGNVGSTGNSTGDHLHLEVRPGAGDPVDPYAALIARGVTP
ncbi:MAG TPA: M23 family metallopeptidase, partial [Nocardioidaceae bacterium]|nr:M23 family metallopeptidase [Nocardioidaceae bacterium]